MSLNFGSLFQRGSAILPSYNWQDILSGNGYVTFNGGLLPSKESTYESYTTGDDSGGTITDSDREAQTFTIGTTGTDEDFYIHKIRIGANGTTDIAVQIQETTSGEPNGTVKIEIQGGLIYDSTGTANWREFHMETAITNDGEALTAGTQYAVVVYRFSGSSSRNARYDNGDGAYSGGQRLTSADSGGSWSAQTGDDLIFEIVGSTINPLILSTATFTSSATTTILKREVAETAHTELGQLNFEGIFNKSAIIKGTAIVNGTISDSADTHYTKVEIYHVRGATETKIGEGTTAINETAIGIQAELTQTTVRPGDKIKLKLIFYYRDSGTNASITVNHNPAGTTLKLHLPFKVDLIDI